MAFGLTATGLVVMTLADLIDDLEAKLRARLGAGISLDANSPEAFLSGIIAEALALAWEALNELYDAFNPVNAQGVQLDNLAGIIGITRLPASPTTVEVELRGTAGTIIPISSIVSKGTGGDQYTLDAAVTLVADYFGAGDDGADGQFTAVETGPLQAPISSIDTIVTPVGGWASASNSAAGVPGADVETDAELRVRMAGSGQVIGSTTQEAIRARLLELDGVQVARVYMNLTDTADASGRPGHTVEGVIYPAADEDADVAELLWSHVAAGIATYGTTGYTWEDSQGDEHELYWTVASTVAVDVNITLTTNADYPADGDDQVEALVEQYLTNNTVGEDAKLHEEIAVITAGIPDDELAGVPGIDSISIQQRRDADPFAASNVTIDEDETATPGTVAVV